MLNFPDVSPTRDASPPPAETIRHGSSKTIVSSEGSPAYNPSWHWPIQPYEHWSQMPAATQERTDSDSDDNKTIPFPQYVEPCVPGFDFMTGTVTEIDPNGSVPPQSDCLPPLLTGIVAPTPQSVAAPMPHNNTPYVPDNHVGVHPRDAGFNVDTNTGLCPNFSRVSIRDAELEALRATIDELTMSVDRVADERDAAIRKVWQVSYNLADAQQAVYIQEEEILEAKRVLIAEQLKTAGLEEEIERRQLKFQEKLGRLQEEQVKKAGECDMQREELREQGKLLEEAEQRVLLASKTTEALNGAAHLVVPEKQTILPCDIVSCFECYANSRECDSLARCRSCVETQSKCARWRCGMYHVLGECSSAPCKLPHSGLVSDGDNVGCLLYSC
jgi:hypothetical protein